MKYLDYLITLTIGLISAVLFEVFRTRYSFPIFLSLLNSTLISFLIYLLLDFILIQTSRLFWPIRCIFYKIHRAEGYWFEKVFESNEHPWSYAVIEYDPWSKQFSYYGRNFNKDFSINAIWESSNVTPDLRENDMQFLFEAVIDSEARAQSVRGFGQLKFKSDLGQNYNRGNGYFLDVGNQTKKYTLEMIRMCKKEVKTVIGSERVKTPIDVEKLVRHCADKYYPDSNV